MRIEAVELARFLLGRRLLVAGLMALATALFATQAARVGFDNSIETYFKEGDVEQYDRFLEHFGSDEIIAVAFDSGDVFDPASLELIGRLSDRLEELPHVRRVLSLTTAKIVFGDQEVVYFEPLLGEVPPDRRPPAAVERRALADPFLPGLVMSRDARSAAVVAEIDHLIGEFDYKIELIGRIRSILGELEAETGQRFRIGGTAVTDDALFRYTQRDQALYLPLVVLIIAGLVFAMFRSLRLALLPLVVVLVSVVWTYGFLGLLGYRVNIITTILTPLLLAVAVADSMHFLGDYLHEIAGGARDRVQAIEQAFANVLKPCLMTSVTTATGLLALLSADLAPIRELGLVAAFGVLSAFVATVLLLPILLSILPLPRAQRARMRAGPLARLLTGLGRWRRRRALAVVVAAALAAGPALVSLRSLTIGTNTLDYLKPDDPVRRATEWIDATIGGTASLEFLVETDEEGALKRPDLLRRMDAFQQYLRGVEGVTGVYSLADLVKSLNRAFAAGAPSSFVVPESLPAVAQQLLLVEGSEDIEQLVTGDYATARIVARVEMARSLELSHRMPDIERAIGRIFGDRPRVTPTGMVHLLYRMEAYLLSSQIKSLGLAFVAISLLMLWMLRSLRLGLVALVPNVLPILFTLALMPLLGIPLDVGTVMIGVIALGLVVDDSIHLLSRFQAELARGAQPRRAMARAIATAGRPIVYTSLALSLGFLVLVLASFNSLIHFGILSAVVILLALVFDLAVLPAVTGFLRLDPGG